MYKYTSWILTFFTTLHYLLFKRNQKKNAFQDPVSGTIKCKHAHTLKKK